MRGWWLVLTLLGCSSAEESPFTYDKADMAGVVVGTWTGTWTAPDTAPSALTLDVRPRSDGPAPRTACNSRVFSETSHPGLHVTCAASSELQVLATLSLGDGSLSDAALSGGFRMDSLNLGSGSLSLTSTDGSLSLYADQDESGAWAACTARDDGAEVACLIDTRP